MGFRSALRKSASLAAIAVCIVGLGCQMGDGTIWKAEVPSPDGLWVAIADTIQNGGFGTASIQTSVYLRRTHTSQRPMEVLGFWCEGPASRPYVLDNVSNAGGTIGLKMQWLSPSHLEVTYEGRASLEFQVVKYAGVDVSVRDLSKARIDLPR
jgi:hypothetical protein